MQALSRREENEVMDIARKHAHKHCDVVVREFAECSAGRTVSMPFACRPQIKAMNSCLREYMTEDRLDTIRLDYISERSDHGRAAVEALRKSRSDYLQKAYGKKEKDGVVQADVGAGAAAGAAVAVHALDGQRQETEGASSI